MPPGGKSPAGQSAAEDHRRKTAYEISSLAKRIEKAGHPAPLGDPAGGVILVLEQPVGPRVLEALTACLTAVSLPDAYVTYASTGLLKEELLAADPQILVAIGPGAARDIDDFDHPLARNPFSEAEEGIPFAWTRGAVGLLLPPLAPALSDDGSKRRFWRYFLTLKNLAP